MTNIYGRLEKNIFQGSIDNKIVIFKKVIRGFMKPNELIQKIRDEYKKARHPIIKSGRIKRGTNRTISSIAEDIFAAFIETRIPKDREIWIDPQITVRALNNKSGKRALLFRPDVCVYNPKKRILEKIFDLKMDVGYNRLEFVKQAGRNSLLLKKIVKHSGYCKLSGCDFKFLPGLECNFIVISDGNIKEGSYEAIEAYFNKNKHLRLFTLVKGHLNHVENGFSIRVEDFKRLDHELKCNIVRRN